MYSVVLFKSGEPNPVQVIGHFTSIQAAEYRAEKELKDSKGAVNSYLLIPYSD